MLIGTSTAKGQITIPKETRDRLGLNPGDRVNLVHEASGRITLRPIKSDFMAMQGILKSKRSRPLTIREMDEAVGRALAAKYRRCK